MKKVGEHVTIDFLGVKKEYSPNFYNKVIYKIAKKAKIEVLNISEKVFKPQGYTCLALLAESHMSFHTFPERGIISFDFFTCGKISPTAALDVLKSENTLYHSLERCENSYGFQLKVLNKYSLAV